jgi:hypothetical protein
MTIISAMWDDYARPGRKSTAIGSRSNEFSGWQGTLPFATHSGHLRSEIEGQRQ